VVCRQYVVSALAKRRNHGRPWQAPGPKHPHGHAWQALVGFTLLSFKRQRRPISVYFVP
jgi:hypothetical protein